MATGTAGNQARVLPWQAVHYIRGTLNYTDATKLIGWLPAGASIHYTAVKVKTAFNDSGSKALTVGQNSTSYNDIVNSADVDESVVQGNMVLRGMDLTFAADKAVYAKWVGGNADATAGQAIVEVCFSINNDMS